ncbi:hypothetical protein [Mesorhizobium sp. B2-1-8]|uniref:hypothetical protein n=1 Tax=Mesorhizobium sp. B2-1-8 TaxID=2589967 RepID=UPI0039EEF068
MPINGLPADSRCTSSFGIAELHMGEGFPDLMRRADEALYLAKNAGRDCVRVSTGPADGLALVKIGQPRISGRG